MEDNSIYDAGALSELTNLQSIYIGNNYLTTCSYFKNLYNLVDLSVSGNSGITWTTYLSGLTNLVTLDLSYTGIGGENDISALCGLYNLAYLDVSYTNVTYDQYLELVESLPYCQIISTAVQETEEPAEEEPVEEYNPPEMEEEYEY